MRNNKVEKTVEYYMNLPYKIEMWRDEEGDWMIQVPDLPHCKTHGSTREEALEMLDDAMRGWLEVAIEYGGDIPEPDMEV